MTSKEKMEAYQKHNGPKTKASLLLKSRVDPMTTASIYTSFDSREPTLDKSTTVKSKDVVSRLGYQTISSSVKAREIMKNNYGMPRISNKRFFPVNKGEAKEQIFRTVAHDDE